MNLSGVFAPLPTPFDRDDRVDVARLRAALARWIASPLTGFVVLGSNGEAVLIDDTEADLVVKTAREIVPADRPFIVGTGRESTQAAIRATKRAADLGADAALVRTPGFFKPQMTADAFVRHYSAVADASPIPILLYNFSALTGVNLPPAAVARLATHENVIGMKESGGDPKQMAGLLESSSASFQVLAGSTMTFYDALRAGASGGILAMSSVAPEAFMRLYTLTRAGQYAEAEAVRDRLAPLTQLGSAHSVPGLKAALSLVGFDVGYPRPPLMPLAEPAVAAFRDAIHALQGSLV